MKLVIENVKAVVVLPKGTDPDTGDAVHVRTINIDSEHGVLSIELRSGLPDNLAPLILGSAELPPMLRDLNFPHVFHIRRLGSMLRGV